MSDPRVHYDDVIEPVTSTGNGVYSLRQVKSTTGVGSLPARGLQRKLSDAEAETSNVEERDRSTKQVPSPPYPSSRVDTHHIRYSLAGSSFGSPINHAESSTATLELHPFMSSRLLSAMIRPTTTFSVHCLSSSGP
jgi:hypothetical protein